MEFFTAKQCFNKAKDIKPATLARVSAGLLIINAVVFALLVWTMFNQ